jgi:hypothetical protein
VLSPLILGNGGSIEDGDCHLIAAWAQKTVLVNMLMTPDRDQARGDHLLGQQLRNLYVLREQPLPQSQIWIGRYTGESRLGSAWATPMTVNIAGLPEPEFPQAYVMTLAVGAVLLQSIHFTTPLLQFDLRPLQGFPRLWPPLVPVDWPIGEPVDDDAFLKVAKGLNLEAPKSPFSVKPWKPATDLEDSEAEGDLVRLPTPCGIHFVYYPGVLVEEAMRGVFYSFITSCECSKGYLVVTESDGAHFKAESFGPLSPGDFVHRRYDGLAGEEVLIASADGQFVCKRLSA